jgi:hypothetical protein
MAMDMALPRALVLAAVGKVYISFLASLAHLFPYHLIPFLALIGYQH